MKEHYGANKASLLSSVFDQLNPLHSLTPYFFGVNIKNIRPSTFTSTK